MGFVGGATASKVGIDTIKRLSKYLRAREIFTKLENKTKKANLNNFDTMATKFSKSEKMDTQNVKMNTKTKNYIDNLPLSSQQEFSDFVDSVLSKDYKNAPNIQRIATINETLKQALKLSGDKVFILKSSLSHFRPERKAKYNQALRIDEIKQIPSIINTATTAYKDETGFFIIFADNMNEKMANFIHFKSDGNGNFVVTAKKADKRTLKNKKPIEDGS